LPTAGTNGNARALPQKTKFEFVVAQLDGLFLPV
jgi:hypothetical protein